MPKLRTDTGSVRESSAQADGRQLSMECCLDLADLLRGHELRQSASGLSFAVRADIVAAARRDGGRSAGPRSMRGLFGLADMLGGDRPDRHLCFEYRL